jgi:hypothetical protein
MAHVAIPDGIVAHRSKLRRKGGVVAAGTASAVAIVGGLLLVLPGRVSGVVGFLLVIAACPLLVAFGVPIAAGISTMAIGVAASLAAWFAIGQWAAIRATQRPIADWRDYWLVLWPLAVAMSAGGFVGAAMFALSVL